VPKVQEGRLVRNRLVQAQVRKTVKRGDLVESLFHRWVAKRKPILHQVHTLHRQRVRPPTASAKLIWLRADSLPRVEDVRELLASAISAASAPIMAGAAEQFLFLNKGPVLRVQAQQTQLLHASSLGCERVPKVTSIAARVQVSGLLVVLG
jgi:hypothetical protein